MDKFKPTQNCIIHHESCTQAGLASQPDDDFTPLKKKGKLVDIAEGTIKPKDISSWTTLLTAAKTRNYEPLLKFENIDTNIPDISYHSKCRKLFILKRDLEVLKKTGSETENAPTRRSVRLQSPPTMQSRTVLKPNCVFCGKVDKWKDRKRVPLNDCCELRADETLRNVAQRKADTKILALCSDDIIGLEAKYHKPCYRDYTRPPRKSKVQSAALAPSEYDIAEENAFLDVCEYFLDIRQNPKIVKLQDLVSRMEIKMSSSNKVLKVGSKKNLKRKLERRFDDQIKFLNVDSTVYVYPSTLTLDQTLLELIEVSQILSRKEKFSDNEKLIMNAGEILRSEIKKIKPSMPWPPEPQDLTKDKVHINHFADIFFNVLLSGSPKGSTVTRVNRLKMSFYQDMVYAVSNGAIKTVKSILYPMAIKSLTNNTELLRLNNLLGHGVSYSMLEEIETAAAIATIDKQTCSVYVPESCAVKIFTLLVYDNIDRRELTLSGANTTHRVNGIIIQPKKSIPEEIKALVEDLLTTVEEIHDVVENLVSTVENDEFSDSRRFAAPGGTVLEPVVIPGQEEGNQSKEATSQKRKKRSIAGHRPSIEYDYVAGKRVGPDPKSYLVNDSKDKLVRLQRKRYFLWTLLRFASPTSQHIPSWTGFFITVRSNVPIMESNVGYLDSINKPATDIATVYEMMKRADRIKDRLKLPSIVIVLDQAMYAKACEVKFKHKEQFKDIVLFMGTFHTLMMILGVAGKRFGDAGFKDVVIHSGIIEEGSIEGVLSGKMYNRSIYAHKIFYEALQRLLIQMFFDWLKGEALGNLFDLEKIHEINENLSPETYEDALESEEFEFYFSDYERFFNELESEDNPLTKFWLSYMEIIPLVLDIIYATRVGDWELFIESIRDLIPWAFAYDRYNYSRFLLIFLGDMLDLAFSHPDVLKAFKEGNFSVQMSTSNTFGRNEADKTIENTVNKDTKTSGGLGGFSLKQAACDRWMINARRRAACYRNFKELVSFAGSKYCHSDLSPSRIKKDEENVKAVIDVFDTTFTNPFDGHDLIGLSSGKLATTEIQHDLLTAKERGEIAMEEFKAGRLSSEGKNNSSTPSINYNSKHFQI